MGPHEIARRSGRARQNRCGAAFAALFVSVTTIATANAWAARLPYHFDSLVFAADQIVEGTIVEGDPPTRLGVKVTFVEHGAIAVGQTVCPEGLSSRLKPGDGIWAWRGVRLDPCDRVILLLKEHSQNLACVVNGTFLVVRGRAFTVGTGPPMAGTYLGPPERLRRDSPTVAEFRQALAAELRHSTALHALLDPPADRKNAARMLAILSTRATTPFHLNGEPPDFIANAAANRLLELGGYAIAAETVEADPDYAWRYHDLFWSASGRDFLIRRIADASVPIEKRERLIPLLGGEGRFRVYYYARSTTRPALADGAPGTLPDDFAKWARLAKTTSHEDERLAGLVLSTMEHPLFLAAHGPEDASMPTAAVVNAEQELRALYVDASTRDSLKYWIERATAAIGMDAYERLHASCGQLMTLATPPDLTRYAAPKPSMLAVGFEYCDVQQLASETYPAAPPITSVYLILEPNSGGSTFVLPSSIVATSTHWTQGSGIDATPLPPGFRPGSYHVHYRLMNGSTIVSEGHGVDLQIPQPGLRVMPVPSGLPARRPPRMAWHASWTVYLILSACAPFLLLVARQLVRSRQRIAWFLSGRCYLCGYDLRGSRECCSECGTAVSKVLPIQVLRRRIIGIAGMAMLSTSALLALLFVRSYVAGDLVTRTTFFRADAAWTSRGVLAVQWRTIGSESGWLHEREQPCDLPLTAADAGPPADLWLLGLEYSFRGRMLVVPLWMPFATMVFVGGAMWRARKPQWLVKLSDAVQSPSPLTA